MDDAILRPLNSISVISGRWAIDNERLYAIEPRLRFRIFRLASLELGTASSGSRPALNPLSYRGSDVNSMGKFASLCSLLRIGDGADRFKAMKSGWGWEGEGQKRRIRN